MRLLRTRRFWVGTAISLVFIALFFWKTDIREIADAFRQANYAIALASLPVFFLSIWVRTIRWRFLMRPVAEVPTRRLYPVAIIGLMANNLIPARAGELVRAYVLGERERVSKMASLGTIAVDRLFDGLTLVPVLVLVGAVAGFSQDLRELAIVMAALFGAALVVLMAAASWESGREMLLRFGLRFVPGRLHDQVESVARSFLDGLRALRNPLDLMAAWAMSLLSWSLEAAMYYIVGIAFSLKADFHEYLMVTAAANLAISVLATQGGVGPFEFFSQQTLVFFGVEQGKAAAYSIALHALLLVPVIIVGLYLLWAINLSFGEMFRRGVEGRAAAASQAVEMGAPLAGRTSE
jgi:uncharacterized protein (TIRG00374 family)